MLKNSILCISIRPGGFLMRKHLDKKENILLRNESKEKSQILPLFKTFIACYFLVKFYPKIFKYFLGKWYISQKSYPGLEKIAFLLQSCFVSTQKIQSCKPSVLFYKIWPKSLDLSINLAGCRSCCLPQPLSYPLV